MICTALRMQAVMSSRSLAVMVLEPPCIWIPKPTMTAKTMRGRMARRLSSSTKSGLVKKFTSISPMPMTLPASASGTS